jgi:predicted secreted acid phosphatase
VLSARSLTVALSCLLIVLATALTGLSSAKEPPAPATPAQIVAYHDSGEWRATTIRKVRKAKSFVRHWLAHHHGANRPKPAIVLDIDDTSLSLYDCAKAQNFVAPVACSVQPTLPAIPQTRNLYWYAIRHNVAVFFITGRPEPLRTFTVTQLRASFYRGPNTLYLRPISDHNTSLVPYKSGARKEITGKGYRILVNIGDQQSDLTGGYAKRTYKLPNPMYFTP